MTKELKTNIILAAVEKMQCLLYFGVCSAACSRGGAQHCKMTMHLGLSVFWWNSF